MYIQKNTEKTNYKLIIQPYAVGKGRISVKKKLIALLLSGSVLTMTLSGCGSSQPTEEITAEGETIETEQEQSRNRDYHQARWNSLFGRKKIIMKCWKECLKPSNRSMQDKQSLRLV